MQQVVAFLAELAIIWYPAHAVPHSWVVPEIYMCVYIYFFYPNILLNFQGHWDSPKHNIKWRTKEKIISFNFSPFKFP